MSTHSSSVMQQSSMLWVPQVLFWHIAWVHSSVDGGQSPSVSQQPSMVRRSQSPSRHPGLWQAEPVDGQSFAVEQQMRPAMGGLTQTFARHASSVQGRPSWHSLSWVQQPAILCAVQVFCVQESRVQMLSSLHSPSVRQQPSIGWCVHMVFWQRSRVQMF